MPLQEPFLKSESIISQMDHSIPFVLIGGAGGEPGTGASYQFEIDTTQTPIVAEIIAGLKARGSTSGPWLPGSQKLRIVQSGGLDLPPKTVPSYLSPRNPESPLYPVGIFSKLWIEKYTERIPTTVVLVVSLDQSDQEIESQVESLRQELRAARSHVFLLVDTANIDDPQPRLAALRKATGLAPRTGLVALDKNTDPSQVCESLWQLLCAQAADFFAARSRETRHKRAAVNSDSDMWEARYTLKLALFSEFKADYEGAIRLYQSAYECLEVVENTEEWLDICAHKIYLFLIYYQRYGTAWAKFNFHLRLSTDPEWLARQYQQFAQTLKHSAVERWAISPDSSNIGDAVPRPGFLYLKAAKLTNDQELAQACFEAAIDDFASMPHSKAAACNDYASWLEQNDPKLAPKFYELALRSLPNNSRLHSLIAHKLAHVDKENPLASLYLFLDGTGPLPTGVTLGAIETPLFDLSGTFMSDTAFIGKPLKFQLTMTPKFKGCLTLETIKIQFSSASVLLTNKTDTEPNSLVTNTASNLSFDHSASKTFELSVMPTQVGEFEFVDIQIHALGLKLDQRLLVSPTLQVVTNEGTRHKWVTPLRQVQVHSRPQLLEVETSGIPAVLYTGEETKIEFKIFNSEDESAQVELVVLWSPISGGGSGGSDDDPTELHKSTISIPTKETMPFGLEFKTPSTPFNILIRTMYTTESNTSPVSSSTSVEIDVVRPFRVNFALEPELHSEQWPNLFVPTDHCAPLPLIRRRWSLNATILSLCEDPIVIKSRSFECTSPHGSITSLQGSQEINKNLEYNQQAKTDMHFEAMRKDRDVRSFDAEADMRVAWSRLSRPEIVNYFTIPTVKLLLPNQEPRVLLQVDFDTEAGLISLKYYIENATSHVLNFAISMPSSPGFMVQGIRATSLRVLPFSRQCLEYSLYPTQDPLSNPIPELRVFDTTYKKVLAVTPDSVHVETENGVSRLKASSALRNF